MDQVAEPFIRRRAIRHLEKGRVVIFGAGTGNPYFTTDTAGSLRAVEIKADAILKGTRVDGIYDSDPKNTDAQKFANISFADAISKNLKVMDMTAFTLCQENNMPIVVFDMNTPGNLLRIIGRYDWNGSRELILVNVWAFTLPNFQMIFTAHGKKEIARIIALL